MADFCKQCATELFGEDTGDLANLGPVEKLGPGEGWATLCETCGPTVVAQDGACIYDGCRYHGKQ